MSDETYKFDIGDVVRLNSGGPLMTVFSRHHPANWPAPTYECEWHDTDNRCVEGTYDERCILSTSVD